MNSIISVVIPCYNQANFLEATLESVLKQTHNDWECIIINDGSTDNTKEIALKWSNYDIRFRYFFKENGGLSSARNAGLKQAKGTYIQFLDGDDLIKPNKFEIQLKDLEFAEISISDYFSFEDGNIEVEAKNRYLSPFLSEKNYKKEIILDWEYRKSIPCHAVLFQKSLLGNYDILFDETLKNHEDWVFWSQLFYVSKKIKNNNEILALYRIRPNSLSVDYLEMKKGFIKAAEVLIKYFKSINEIELLQATQYKKKEILNKNYQPLLLFKSILKIKAKLKKIYRYVNQN